MSDEEKIWDEATGKLVPKSGYKSDTGSVKRGGDAGRDTRPTRKRGAGRDRAAVPEEPGDEGPGTTGTAAPGSGAAGAQDNGDERAETPAAGALSGPPKRVGRGRDEKTTAHGADEEEEGVAGWLAFLDRSVKGGFSVVRPGQNSIGRGPENHIVIAGERTVTREAAAFIIVDPEDRSAHLRPGMGRSIIRVNGELITESCVLTPGDRIRIGKVTCMYVPFPWDAVPDDEAGGDA